MGRAFRVNGYQRNWQEEPDVIAMADGGFLIVYSSYVNNYDGGPVATVVSAQRFDAQGRFVGPETVVDGIDGTRASEARVALLSDGGYAVTWLFDNYGPILTTEERVYVRVFDPDGTPRTEAIRVDAVGGNEALWPEIHATADGGFRVVFGMDRSTDLFDQIYAQRFDAQGNKIGGNRLLNENEGQFDQFLGRSAVLADGGAITIWNSEGSFPTAGDLDSNEIRGTITGPAGVVLRSDFSLAQNYGTVGGGTGAGYDVAALEDGGFVVVHKNYDFELGLDTDDTSYYVVMRFFDARGRAEGGPLIVHADDRLPGDVRAVQLDTGDIAIVWEQADRQTDFTGDAIYGRYFTADGRPLGGRFEVAPLVDVVTDQVSPELAALPGGRFVVTWESDLIDNSHSGIAARIFLGPPGAVERVGTAAADRLVGTARDDMLAGRGGADVLLGRAGADELHGGDGGDRLVGAWGRDTLLGGNGDDVLEGGAGADLLRGGAGRDVLWGGDARDVLEGGAGFDRLFGGGGDDTLRGGTSRDVLAAGAGADRLFGGRGDDRLAGGDGRDALHGGEGRDVLEGGRGADRLAGGAGRDVFVFGAGDGPDLVLDFSAADRLRLDDDLWGGRALSAAQVVERFADDAGPDVVLRFGEGDVLRLQGVAGTDGLAEGIVIV